jgi:ATP-dependent helicase/nuclease subunit A
VALTRARDRLILCGRLGARTTRDKVGGWYAAAEAALAHADIAGGVRELAEGDQVFRRYGSDPERLEPAPAPKSGQTDLPVWLTAPPPIEPTPARHVSPSQLGEAARDPALSPLSEPRGLGRFRRGTLIHKLLQVLPDIAPEQRGAAAAKLLGREPDLDETQRAEMTAAALAVLDDPVFAAVFGPGSRAEVAVAGAAADLPADMRISGQIDRLAADQNRVLVVDFKTNRPAPQAIETADPAYIRQMAAYVAVLREAFPGKAVEAALIWTDGPKLMPIPEKLISAALAELGRSS